MHHSKLKVSISAILAAAIIGALFLQARHQETRLRDLQRALQALEGRQQAACRDSTTWWGNSPPGEQVEANAARLAREMTARKARAENGTTSSRELQPGLKPLSALSYAGQSTPLATVDSGLWAIYHGDIDQLTKLITLTPAGNNAAATLFSSLPAETQAQLQNPEYMIALLIAYGYNAVGYQVLGDHQNSDDPANWTVQAVVQLEDGRTIRPNTTLQESNGSWQVEFDQNAVKQFAFFLTGAVAPPAAGQ
jgi:type II secretory pathway pseudopilin PulG